MPKPGRFFNGVELGFGIERDGVDASSLGTTRGRQPAVQLVFAGVETVLERVSVVGVGVGWRCLRVGRRPWFIALGRSLSIGNPK